MARKRATSMTTHRPKILSRTFYISKILLTDLPLATTFESKASTKTTWCAERPFNANVGDDTILGSKWTQVPSICFKSNFFDKAIKLVTKLHVGISRFMWIFLDISVNHNAYFKNSISTNELDYP